MITVEAIGQSALVAKLKNLPERFQAELYKRMKIRALLLTSYIKKDELSGQLLNVRSGDLRDSITDEVQQSGTGVIARVFSAGNIPYAKPLNDGCGPYEIYPVNAKALMFEVGGQTIFAAHVHHPGQKPRKYMQLGLDHEKDAIVADIKGALKGAWA